MRNLRLFWRSKLERCMADENSIPRPGPARVYHTATSRGGRAGAKLPITGCAGQQECRRTGVFRLQKVPLVDCYVRCI